VRCVGVVLVGCPKGEFSYVVPIFQILQFSIGMIGLR
jgi:hypothetical protein